VESASRLATRAHRQGDSHDRTAPDCRRAQHWRVDEEGARAPLSEHTNATDAERAALTRADDRVVVHDR
jgi:hypothetical protein